MSYQIFITALFWGLVLATHPESQKSPTTLHNRQTNSGVGIYDGTNTTISKHPYLVGLVHGGEFWCAGVIVNSHYVLTLGDCVNGMTEAKLTVMAGSETGTSGGTSYGVSKIIQHPKYTYLLDYDFALLEINSTFTWGTTVGQVTLPSKAPAVNTALVVSGWGNSSSDEGASEGSLKQGNMKVIAQKACKNYYSGYSVTFTTRMGCAYNKGKTTCCKGDFGDPFVKKNVLYGLFAAAGEDWCTESSIPIIYANVYPVVDWIKNYTLE